ncbi:MAG: A24 family peptidase [Phycisphaerae bacterium]|jgi:prepilin peptidase CpaA
MPPQNVAWWAYWPYFVLALTLLTASFTDVRQGTIPNWITYPSVLVGLAGHTIVGGLTGRGPLELGLAGSAGGLAAGFLPLMVAWLAGGIGGGDAKVMGAVGALTGWRFTLAAMLYGFAVAAVMAVIVMIMRKTTRQTLGRIWRFLVLIFTPGPAVDPASKSSAKIPFGLALCIGAALALVEVVWRGPVARKLLLGW